MTEQFDSYVSSLLSENLKNRYARILAHLTPDNIKAARDWISECDWDDLPPDEIEHLTDLEIVRGVEQQYEGGWNAFLKDNRPV